MIQERLNRQYRLLFAAQSILHVFAGTITILLSFSKLNIE